MLVAALFLTLTLTLSLSFSICIAAQQHLSFRGFKHGDCHGAQHVMIYLSSTTTVITHNNINSRSLLFWVRSGKSTYLQQICLIVILAQIGCYIPARFATLRVVDRVFTRMGTLHNLESNSSTVRLSFLFLLITSLDTTKLTNQTTYLSNPNIL